MIIVAKVSQKFQKYSAMDMRHGSYGIEQMLNAMEKFTDKCLPVITVSCLGDLIVLGIQKEDVEMVDDLNAVEIKD